MIKLFSLKQQKKDGEQTSKTGTQKKASAAQLRIQKGILFISSSNHYKEIYSDIISIIHILYL